MSKRIVSLIVVLVLVGALIVIAILRSSYAIWNNIITGNNDSQMTTGYVMVKVNGSDDSINVTNPQRLSDMLGISLVGEGYNDITISYSVNHDVQYELGIVPVGDIDSRNVKFYLTDSNDYVCDSYKDGPKLFNELQVGYDLKGKVLHSGILSMEEGQETFKLRIWFDEAGIDNSESLVYKVYIKIK